MSTSANEPAIRVERLRKSYGRSVALDGADLHVAQGESWALLGPNGSGKTTLLRIVSTVAPPSGGSARVFGLDVTRNTRDVRRIIGYVPQLPSTDLELTCVENLHFAGGLFGLGPVERRVRIAELLDFFGLGESRDRVAGELSGGMNRRLELARAMVHEPRLLLLDEPSTGLDPRAQDELWELLDRLRRERGLTCLMATHRLDDAERACGRVGILRRGRVTATVNVGGGPALSEIYSTGAEED